MNEPPDVQSIRSLLEIGRILALVIALLFAGLGALDILVSLGSLVPAVPVVLLIFALVNFVIFLKLPEVRRMVDQHQYERAKSETLIWTIVGLVLGGVIVGILLVVVWIKFDQLFNWQRGGYAPATPGFLTAPMAGPAPSASTTSAMTPPNPAPPGPGVAPICPRCQRPGTWIVQYQRYYCYTDAQYL